MKPQKFIPERITRRIETPLTPIDRIRLSDKRKREILIYIPAYIAIIGICIYVYLTGPENVYHQSSKGFKHEITDEEVINFWTVAPYVCGFVMVLSTAYITWIYFRTINPITRDLKNNIKDLVYFIPTKSAMSFFNRYYLSTPLYETQQVEISAEDYSNLNDHEELYFELAPLSCQVLRLCNDGKEIDYSL